MPVLRVVVALCERSAHRRPGAALELEPAERPAETGVGAAAEELEVGFAPTELAAAFGGDEKSELELKRVEPDAAAGGDGQDRRGQGLDHPPAAREEAHAETAALGGGRS